MLSRCARCEQLYRTPGEEQECCFHPGQHRRLGWTCCRDPSAAARGCRFGVHFEDAAATAALDGLWMCAPAQRGASDSSEPAEAVGCVVFEDPSGTLNFAKASASQDSQPAERVGDGGTDAATVLVPYLVGPFDTFSAICMRHQMTAEELMRVNGLRRGHARPGSTVLVWAERSAGAVQEEVHRALLMAFRRRCKCGLPEARYYLETNDYEMEGAVQQRNEELQWERTEQGQAAAQVRLPPPAEEELGEEEQGAARAAEADSGGPPCGLAASVARSVARCVLCVPSQVGRVAGGTSMEL